MRGIIKTDITGIGDPFVLLFEDTYYMYATSSPNGFHVYSSEDLITWRDRGLCYKKKGSFGYKCFWAPEVTARSDGKFVMHFSAKDRKRRSLRIGAAVSDSPLGPFYDANEGAPMFDPDYAIIDAHCFTDNDGQSYLLYVRDVSENICADGIRRSEIYIAPLDRSLTRLVEEGKCILSPSGDEETSIDPKWQWNEGPFVLEAGGRYYLNYSYNCFNVREYSVGVAEAESIAGPYKKTDRRLLIANDEMSGPGHNSYFRAKDGTLMCAFHIHTDPKRPSGNRRACFVPAELDGGLKLKF